jgi:hypothetical protein
MTHQVEGERHIGHLEVLPSDLFPTQLNRAQMNGSAIPFSEDLYVRGYARPKSAR